MNPIHSDAVGQLTAHLNALPAGPVEDSASLIARLVQAWPDLGGTDAEATYGHKLKRMEDPRWEPPRLTFALERHGATVLGSTRAAVHNWVVDTDAGCATITAESTRQVRERARPLKVGQLADELLTGIEAGTHDDPRLEWISPNEVVVVIRLAIPPTVKETTQARRKRLRAVLDPEMIARGWSTTPKPWRYLRLPKDGA